MGSLQLSWLVLGDAWGQMGQACLCCPGSHAVSHPWAVVGVKARGGLGQQG